MLPFGQRGETDLWKTNISEPHIDRVCLLIINKTNMDLQNLIIKKVGADKLLHFFAGGWIAAFAADWWMAVLIAVFIGFLKELYDLTIRKSVFDWIDWLATALGGGVTAILLVLI